LGTTTYSFRVKLTDGTNNTYRDLSIKVIADNDPPVIQTTSLPDGTEASWYSKALSGYDPEGQAITSILVPFLLGFL